MKSLLFIFGGSGTALEIFETVQDYFIDKFDKVLLVIPDNEKLDNCYNYITDSQVKSCTKNNKCSYIIGFTDQKVRTEVQALMKSLSINPINIINPSSKIFNSAKVGDGNYIAANTVISRNAKIGDHCIINFNSTIGHDSFIDNNCIILPGARVGGNVSLGKRVLVGSNSFIFQGKTISDDCLIDALTYVDKDIAKNSICSSKNLKVLKRVI
jgi:sugar O-acyltransferase (sialic acid O-acetyltransferase NeuD family)